jgi:hypothetical protein
VVPLSNRTKKLEKSLESKIEDWMDSYKRKMWEKNGENSPPKLNLEMKVSKRKK